MKLYKSTTQSDKTVYTSTEILPNTPEGFLEVERVFHVRKAKRSEKEDYKVENNKVMYRFVYTSAEGKAEGLKGRLITTPSVAAVTNPACLKKLGIETMTIQAKIAELIKEEEEAEKAAAKAKAEAEAEAKARQTNNK